MQNVERETGEELPVRWRYFSLEQNNHSPDPEKKVWENNSARTRGIDAFRAAEAVRRQDVDLFKVFHKLLLNAVHKERRDMTNTEVLKDIAEKAGADMNRFLNDFNDRTILNRLAEDHFYAVNELKVFGTPTFVFNGNNPVFLKVNLSDDENSYDLFKEFLQIAENRKNVLEIKRP
ncbi:MAG: DsbA family protein [Dehalococcoidales bacterium]|nr:MAG: DsbA family protein [Dehalococcoidales bacterium]